MTKDGGKENESHYVITSGGIAVFFLLQTSTHIERPEWRRQRSRKEDGEEVVVDVECAALA